MNWETYLALGDSITIGARTYLGYPELVGSKLSKRLNKQWNVINTSVSGFKAIDLARHMDTHFSSLVLHKSSITSILIGTNDIKTNTVPEEFKIALTQIIIKAKLLTTNQNVVLLLIPEFHKGIAYPYSIEMNSTIAVFNDIITSLANEQDIRVLQLSNANTDFFDGVHLNTLGIESFSNQIVKFILKDKGLDIG